MACGNGQVFGVTFGVNFAAVIDMSSDKMMLALARKWQFPAMPSDILNANMTADKEEELDIYICVPQRMRVDEDTRKKWV